MADEVTDRERANFCGYFTPVAGAGPRGEDGAGHAARSDLDALFGPSSGTAGSGTAGSPSDANEARRRLDALFGIESET